MKHGIYVIYDKVAEESGPMFEAVNNGIALRMACNTLKPLPPQLCEDYQLVKIGEYDTKSMQIEIIPPEEISMEVSLMRMREWGDTSLEVIK